MHARIMGVFLRFYGTHLKGYHSSAPAQTTKKFTFAVWYMVEMEFLFYPQEIIIPFKNCIVDGDILRKFYYYLPVMFMVKAIHQHCVYSLFQIKKSVTLISMQNRKNNRFYFLDLQMILYCWCKKHL